MKKEYKPKAGSNKTIERALATLYPLLLLVVGGLLVAAVDTIVRNLVGDYNAVREHLDNEPVLWIVMALFAGLGIAVYGLNRVEAQIAAMEAQIDHQSEQILELEKNVQIERQKSGEDRLTGLPNQDRFEGEISDLFNQSTEKDHYSLLYIDLLELKKINDTQGDEYGSRFIEKCSSIISQSMYRRERIFRAKAKEEMVEQHGRLYRSRSGGDEFFLLIRTDLTGSLFTVRRLITDLVRKKEEIFQVAQSLTGKRLAVTVGFRCGLTELQEHRTPESAVSEVKSVMLHTRLGDLPDAVAKYTTPTKPITDLSDKQVELLLEINNLILNQQ